MNTNRRTRNRPARRPDNPSPLSPPSIFLWSLIGLLLTIVSTFVQVSVATAPWNWSTQGILPFSLGVSYQIGAVLLTACMGGKTAGTLAQIAYLFIGLAWMPVFAQGGGISYIKEPSFGYLLGFIPGAWFCGWWAFRQLPKLENFAIASLIGLGIIHAVGIVYLLALTALKAGASALVTVANLPTNLLHYSLAPLPGQLVIVCVVAVLTWVLRRLLFY